METKNKPNKEWINVNWKEEIESLEKITEGSILYFESFGTKSLVVDKSKDAIYTIGRRKGWGEEWINEVINHPKKGEENYFLRTGKVNIHRRKNSPIYIKLNNMLMERGL